MYSKTTEALETAIDSYARKDIETAKQVNNIVAEVDRLQKKYRDLHIKRLYDGTCNAYAGAIYLDLLSNLERVSDHSLNIAESIIENS